MSTFKIGDRVRIKQTSRYHTHSTEGSNPGLIEGTIDQVEGGYGLHIGVLWDNGKHNSYGDDDLKLVKGSKTPEKVEVDEGFIREAYAAAGLTMQMKLEKKFPDLFGKIYRIGQRFINTIEDDEEYILANASPRATEPMVVLINLKNGNLWHYASPVKFIGNITEAEFKNITHDNPGYFKLISK